MVVAVCAGLLAGSMLLVGTIGAQEPPEPGVPVVPSVQGGGECDPATGEVVWAVTWTNPFDVEMTIVIEYYRFSNDSIEVDLAPLFPAALAPGESVTMGPERFPGDELWGMGYSYEVYTELSEDPVPVSSVDVGYSPCPQPPAPVVTAPRFTG